MNATDQVETVEVQINETAGQDIELTLSDLDLVGGGNVGAVFA